MDSNKTKIVRAPHKADNFFLEILHNKTLLNYTRIDVFNILVVVKIARQLSVTISLAGDIT